MDAQKLDDIGESLNGTVVLNQFMNCIGGVHELEVGMLGNFGKGESVQIHIIDSIRSKHRLLRRSDQALLAKPKSSKGEGKSGSKSR